MINPVLKSLFLTFLRTVSPKLGDRASILMYHSVAENNAFFTVRPDEFEKQLEYLKTNHFNVITISELVGKIKNKESFENSVVITFDDGYMDNYELAFPLLKKYNFPAAIFVPTDLIGKTYTTSDGTTLPIMSERELKELSKSSLIEILPHTHTHVHLDELLQENIKEEIFVPTNIIQKITGHTPKIFSYPRGKHSEHVMEILKEEGYDAAVTVQEGLVKIHDDLYTLKRNSIDSSTTFSQFKAKVSGAIDLYMKLK